MKNKLEIVVTQDNHVKATTPKSYYHIDLPLSNDELLKELLDALIEMSTLVIHDLEESESENV